jgi:hypothetical protein
MVPISATNATLTDPPATGKSKLLDRVRWHLPLYKTHSGFLARVCPPALFAGAPGRKIKVLKQPRRIARAQPQLGRENCSGATVSKNHDAKMNVARFFAEARGDYCPPAITKACAGRKLIWTP